MSLATVFAAWIVAPFLALSAWFGGHAALSTTPPAHNQPVFCTMEAKICPDGSAVGRVPPSCDFAPCPAAPNKPAPKPQPKPVPTPAPAAASVSIWRVAPSRGSVGTQVSITGFGFTGNNTIIMDGLVAVRHVPISGQIAIACTTDPSCHGGINQTLTFTIPDSLSPNCPEGSMCPLFVRQVTPGSYTLVVQNENGSSNEMQLTITDDSSHSVSASASVATTPLY